jgi:hypothetical protein
MKLAALRRVSAASTSIQPADPASQTTATSATTLPTSVPTNERASSRVPTTSPTSTVPAANLAPSASSPSHISNAPTVAPPDIPPSLVSSTNSDDLSTRPGHSSLQKRFALPGEKIPSLTKNPTRAQVMNITTTLQSTLVLF